MKPVQSNIDKIDPLKKVLFKRSVDTSKGHKSITLAQTTEDAESVTNVIKSFRYRVSLTSEDTTQKTQPEIYIEKVRDANQQLEQFDFRVQGSFYMAQNRLVYKVEYQHELHIDIYWKKKVFSPKKSVVLT